MKNSHDDLIHFSQGWLCIQLG